MLAYFPFEPWGTKTHVTFLDVGQGDCIVIETDQGKTILIDGGGTPNFSKEEWQVHRKPFEVGRDVIVPFLKYRGIREIDTLIISHGDLDHIGGLQAVVSQFPVKRVIRNALRPQSKTEEELMALLIDRGATIVTVFNHDAHLIEEGITWQFLHPSDTEQSIEGTSNHQSVVLLMSIYQHRLLFTGDIEKETEDQLLAQWQLPPVDVLKVAHHGSKTSTQAHWLAHIQPKEAIISCGRKNRYGHPSPIVIQRLQKYQARIWRTDQHGGITISFDKDHYTMNPTIVK